MPLARLEAVPPDPAACRAAGDAFLQAAGFAALSASSVVVPQEHNLLINPAHPSATGVRTVRNEPFAIDARLF